MMLRKKRAEKRDSNGLRPESPGGDGRNRRKTKPLVPRVASISKRSSHSRASMEVSLQQFAIDNEKKLLFVTIFNFTFSQVG